MNRVMKFQVPGIENAYVLVSGYNKEKDDPDYIRIEYHMSFLYDAGNVAAEWEPRYGPIRIWKKAILPRDKELAKEHYYYDYVFDTPLNWSQLAVEENGLQPAFLRGDLAHIFGVLKRWAEKR